MSEVQVPYTTDDFELNDDVFHLRARKTDVSGRVIDSDPAVYGKVVDVDEDIIEILMEDGQRHWLSVGKFKHFNSNEGIKLKLAKESIWGKMMDVTELSEGSAISRFDSFEQIRVYGTITKLVFPTAEERGIISLHWSHYSEEIPYSLKNMNELKRLMLMYDLED